MNAGGSTTQKLNAGKCDGSACTFPTPRYRVRMPSKGLWRNSLARGGDPKVGEIWGLAKVLPCEMDAPAGILLLVLAIVCISVSAWDWNWKPVEDHVSCSSPKYSYYSPCLAIYVCLRRINIRNFFKRWCVSFSTFGGRLWDLGVRKGIAGAATERSLWIGLSKILKLSFRC